MRDIRILCAARAASSLISSFAARYHASLTLTPARTIKASKSIRQKLNSPAHFPVHPVKTPRNVELQKMQLARCKAPLVVRQVVPPQQIHKPHPRNMREVKKS